MINEGGIINDLGRGYYLRLIPLVPLLAGTSHTTVSTGVPAFSSNSPENIPEIKIRLKRSRAPKER